MVLIIPSKFYQKSQFSFQKSLQRNLPVVCFVGGLSRQVLDERAEDAVHGGRCVLGHQR